MTFADELVLRMAVPEDIPALLDILVQVGRVHAEGRPDLFCEGACKYTAEELSDILKDADRPILLACRGEQVLASAYLQLQRREQTHVVRARKSVYVDDFCVRADARGSHVGTFLMQQVIAFAKQRGADEVTLNVYEFNRSAICFYESLGMTTCSRHMELLL